VPDSLVARGVKLSLGGTIYDPPDPMGKMFFNILATFAEFGFGRAGLAQATAHWKEGLGKYVPNRYGCRDEL
jgi:hypothetical protein